MSTASKNEEGLSHIQKAEKHLTVTMLKWWRNYDSAAEEYSKAAVCFRVARNLAQAKHCWLKAVECLEHTRLMFKAAKALDQCVLLSKEMSDVADIAELARRASNLYQNEGNIECASSSLSTAAGILEKTHPEQALNLYMQAADIVMNHSSNPGEATKLLSKVSRIHVKMAQYDSAAESIRREMVVNQRNEQFKTNGRLTVALVLVHLARQDVVAAGKAFREWGGACEDYEVETLERLLGAYDDEDAEAAQKALNDPFIKSMDVEYAILARQVPLPQGVFSPPKPAIRMGAAPSYVSPYSKTAEENLEADEEGATGDELGGGLC